MLTRYKNGIGCIYAVRSVHNAVENIVNSGNNLTVETPPILFCAIELSKAFDKVNHFALFSKVMKRHIPNELHYVSKKFTLLLFAITKSDVNRFQ